MAMKGTILIVEDDIEINNLLAAFLQENGYETVSAYDGRTASAYIREREYTIVLMDIMLPYKSGDVLIRELRERSDAPVICLSAKSDIDTRLDVLRMGADDYIIKPFDLNEVLVRIEVVLRRAGMLDEDEDKSSNIKNYKKLSVDFDNNCAMVNGRNLVLTAKELAILQLFLTYPNKTFSKANIYEAIWQDIYYYEDNTLNVHMSNLRNKLKKADGDNEYIETVWGIGYRLSTK